MRYQSLVVAAVCLAAAGEPAESQSLVQLFGGQRHVVPIGRGRHRAPRSLHGSATLGSRQVPLPVPRPHFASDDLKAKPTSTAQAPTAAAEAQPIGPPAKPPVALKPIQAAPEAAPESKPVVAPSGATTAFTPRQPAEDIACYDRLTAGKAVFERVDIGAQPDARCTVVQPVRLASIGATDGSSIALPDRPTIACATADAFRAFVHDLLAPLAKGSFGTTLTTVWTGPGLECRSRDHIFGAKLSAHGQGLAVDIAQIRLADGRTVEVGTPKTEVDAAFETASRAGACGYFHTVLGPGSDSYHRTHWHFDLEVRGKQGDGKYCK